jgi:DNA-binding NarL/FixJ family response regulator
MRIVIAEDQVLLREGPARLFEDGGHQVAASRGDARDLVATVAGHKPDLVVLDIRMPPTLTDEGARAAHEIKQAQPDQGPRPGGRRVPRGRRARRAGRLCGRSPPRG